MTIKVTEQQYNDIIEKGLTALNGKQTRLKYLDRLYQHKYIVHSCYRIPTDPNERRTKVRKRLFPSHIHALSKYHTTSLKPSDDDMVFLPSYKDHIGTIYRFKNYDDMVWCSEQSKYNRIIGTSPKNMQYRCVLRFDGRHYNDDDCELMRRNLENIENTIGGWDQGEAHITKAALLFQNNDDRYMPNTVTMDFKDELGLIAATTFLESRQRFKTTMFEYQKW